MAAETERLALTAELVSSHRLPRIPGNPKSKVYRKYIPDGRKTEIESLDPRVLAQLVRDVIEGCIDKDARKATEAEEQEAQEKIRDAVAPVLAAIEKARGSA
ncbi:MAG: hypothetical protein ACYCVV_19850 [Acidimicrobiales bacterium]